MIELNASLLSHSALENLIIEIMERENTICTTKIDFELKKHQLLQKIQLGLSVIVYCAKKNFFDVIPAEKFQQLDT
ncbi:hypothetical protein [Fluoribacter gormanii]|uniref:hypothetical protein n=1 Tax=Fluoribacter gormanii TaxID=464 RepID=UPI0010419287|nr:hypothetical protein [Fluoribacter gormanii]